jgi:hypothetical protein
VHLVSARAWDTEQAAELARTAYRYVAKVYPKEAPLTPLGVADMRVLEAQEAGDWQVYEEALRELCRTARREAIMAERVKVGAA